MAVCLHCQFANPDQAGTCGRCGRSLVVEVATALSAPLPARMTEPIQPLSRPPADERPLTGTLGNKSVAVVAATPAPATLRGSPTDRIPTQDGIPPGGTVPAHPGLPGHPMNEAALQSSPHTVPATDPADSSAAPLPQAPPGRPKFLVLRGLKINAEYPIYEGRNTIGRFADKPVDIDLVSQESVEQIWCSRQHAVVTLDHGVVVVEDMNSLNGTWVNGARIHAGQHHQLKHGDIVQVGTVQLKLVIG